MFVCVLTIFSFCLSVHRAYMKLLNTLYWEEDLHHGERATVRLERSGIIFRRIIFLIPNVWVCHSAMSSCQRQWWVVISTLPFLPEECNHFRMDTTWLICWKWETISIFSLSECTLTWPHFSAFLRWFVQSYLCVWCTAMSSHASCLKASPLHPDIIAVTWLFSQPLCLLFIFIGRLFGRHCLILCLFSVHLSKISCMRGGEWTKGSCDLKNPNISIFICQLMKLLFWKLVVRRKKVCDTKLTRNGYQRDDVHFWNEWLCMMSTWISKQPVSLPNVYWDPMCTTIRPRQYAVRKGALFTAMCKCCTQAFLTPHKWIRKAWILLSLDKSVTGRYVFLPALNWCSFATNEFETKW